MRIIETKIYTFDELGDDAKENARAWYRENIEYPWFSECLDSLKSFCNEFGVKVLDYCMGDARRDFVKTDATPANFRGVKLKSFDREAMPTGFCFDSDLRYTFFDEFQKTGDAFYAFNLALENFLQCVRNDIDSQYENNSVDENIAANECEFTENGVIVC